MAHQPFVGGMVRHRHAAPRALRHVAALAAQQHPRAAAPVEKQNALLAAFDIFFKLCAQRMTDRGLVPLPQLVLHVGDQHLGKRQIVEPLMKGKDLIASVFGSVCRFNRRRGRAEQQQRVVLRTAELRDVARVVARRIFGLITRLLLFIQNDEPEVLQRCEHRAARAQHDAHLTAADALPLVVALGERQRAVQHRDVAAELRRKAAQHLRRQRDLRHEQHGGLAERERFFDEPDIDLRLAAGGHAMQQRGAAALAA